MDGYTTLPAMLQHVTATYQNAHALNVRESNRWEHISSESFALEIRRMALGLVALGLKRGQSVGILADPSPWWLMADLAIQAAGGVTVPLFPRSAETNLKFKIKDASIRMVFVSDQASARSFQMVRRLFAKVIIRGSNQSGGGVMGTHKLGRLGDALSAKQPALFTRLCRDVRASDPATIIYTSGSSGIPKGVVLTQGNLVCQLHAASERFQLDCSEDQALSVLPLAHAFERVVVYSYFCQGVSVWFADTTALAKRMLEVRPTCMSVVPRLLEKVYAGAISKIEAAGVARRPIGRWALKLAHSESKEMGLMSWRQNLAQKLVFGQMRQALGGRLRVVFCGGSTLSSHLCHFFWNIGVPTYQGYGLTETSPVICANYPGHNRIGTVGQPFPGVEVKISEEGEILTRGPHVMAGYHHNPSSTNDVVDAEGFLHTGDLGHLDKDGYLTITGRIKELYKTAGGKLVCPTPIEIALTASPVIDRAYVVAEGKTYPSCLLFPDTSQARQILGLPDESQLPDDRMMGLPQLNEEIQRLVELVNLNLEPWEQIRKYRLVADDLTVGGGGLTPTQKLRRSFLDRHYKELIDSMYTNEGRSL